MIRPALVAAAVLSVTAGSACTLLITTDDIRGGRLDDSRVDGGAPESGDSAAPDAGVHAYVAAVLADEPVMYFRLEEQDGLVAKDETGRHQGQYFGAYALGAEGAFPGSRGVSFDGRSGGASATDAIDVSGNRPFSIECWFKPSAYDTVFRLPMNIQQGSVGQKEAFGVVVTSGGGIGTERWVQGTGSFTNAEHPNIGTYHHVVATYDGTTARLFVDGLIVDSRQDARAAAGGVYTVWLGARAAGTESIMGLLDEVAVYDKALDPRRVASHFVAAGG